MAIAVEHLTDDIDAGAIRLIDPDLATNLRSNEELPDLTAMIRYGGDWGHVRLGGILRKIGYDTVGTVDNEPSGSETGWGVNATGSFKVSLATIRLGVVYGEGVASYMNDGGMDLAPSAALGPPVPAPLPIPIPPPNILVEAEAVPILGVSGYVDLQWTSEISSAIGYSLVEVENTNFQTGDAFHRGEYASANVLWAPDPRILTGLELLWGQRTDNDGASGEDMRMQFTFKVSFSSKNIWDVRVIAAADCGGRLAGVQPSVLKNADRFGDELSGRRRVGELIIEPEPLPFVLAQLVERQDLDPLDHAQRRRELGDAASFPPDRRSARARARSEATSAA